jgi:hypothetical protein
MLKHPHLFQQGLNLSTFPLSHEVRESVKNKDWFKVDELMKSLTKRDAPLYEFLKTYHDFNDIEFIISIRDASSPWEEDGIWHDDGSRVFAFSLSLTLNSEEIEGGKLGIRPKGEESFLEIPTPEFGGIILFLTGAYGFEHKIHRVTKGVRIIMAGWCS